VITCIRKILVGIKLPRVLYVLGLFIQLSILTCTHLCREVVSDRSLAQVAQGTHLAFQNLLMNGTNPHGELPRVTPKSYQTVPVGGEHHLNRRPHHRRPMKEPNRPGIRVQNLTIIKEVPERLPGEQAPAMDGVLRRKPGEQQQAQHGVPCWETRMKAKRMGSKVAETRGVQQAR